LIGYLFGSLQVRKPGQTEVLEEAIYYKHDEPFERPVEVFDRSSSQCFYHFLYFQIVNRPVIRETMFLPDRKVSPLVPGRDAYVVRIFV
jgi:hypothetical protein